MTDKHHADFGSFSVTVTVDYEVLQQTGDAAKALWFEWNGRRPEKPPRAYIGWINGVLSTAARRVNKKILYGVDFGHAAGFEIYGYEPDGSFKRLK